MTRATRFIPGCVAIALAACGCKPERPPAPVEHVVPPPPETMSGNSHKYGIAIRRILLEATDAGVDARFEIENQGRSIVSVAAVEARAGPEVTLAVETFRDGTWKREPSTAHASAHFHELWPGATAYGRAMIPADERWARVLLTGRGLVELKVGTNVRGDLEVSGDAFEIPTSR